MLTPEIRNEWRRDFSRTDAECDWHEDVHLSLLDALETAERDRDIVRHAATVAAFTPCSCSAQRARAEAAEARLERVRELAEGGDLWRTTPCGCGHRADLHDAGDLNRTPMCHGGLGICPCTWSFWRIAQERLNAALAPTSLLTEAEDIRQREVEAADEHGLDADWGVEG